MMDDPAATSALQPAATRVAPVHRPAYAAPRDTAAQNERPRRQLEGVLKLTYSVKKPAETRALMTGGWFPA